MNNNNGIRLFPALSALKTRKSLSDLQGARIWFLMALSSLILSGIAPLVLLAGRASVYAEMELVKQWFVPVLVIHVNLSVGLWFLALMLMVWRLLWPCDLSSVWHKGAQISFGLGIIGFALTPLAGGAAYTSNYIPVHDNPLFFISLSLVFSALLLMLAAYLLAIFRKRETADFTQMLVSVNVLTCAIALACFALSVMQHPDGVSGEPYYEAIFWGGGHVLQFVYVQLAMIAWIALSEHLCLSLPSPRLLNYVITLLFVAVLVSPLIYIMADITDYYHIKFFSWQMNIATGTLPGLLAIWILFTLKYRSSALFWALLMSVVLFLSGGLVGYMIEGSNTIIPAHYHGSTVGVTLSLMGLIYLLLPAFKCANVMGWRSAKWQPVLYGGGQLLHVIGFAIAGSEGAGRKIAGKMEDASELAEFGMQLVRLGGGLAVIGGALFVIVVIRAYRKSPERLHA